MLFNSFIFILAFLPVIILGTHVARKSFGYLGVLRFLLLASLFFYGYWNPIYLLLIGGSILTNYLVAGRIVNANRQIAHRWLLFGVTFNLLLIGLFKYADFLIGTINWLPGVDIPLQHVVLPLAISFFTFQQIAFLMDMRTTQRLPCSFEEYAFFVTFFPQLIAGPIVHHAEVTPQYRKGLGRKPELVQVAMGLVLFVLGLAKKVLIADKVAIYSTPVFDAVAAGYSPPFLEAWSAALSYTFQLYFDFSGYCDMAIGLGLLFGIRLPLNFNSPYKATNIIDFWRRWHMTLSRFLRDYLYIPLGGNRHGTYSRYRNILLTMVLGGLWHGASWSFVIWGALHGFYIVINHGWHWLLKSVFNGKTPHSSQSGKLAGWALTFLAVVIGWVFFRAEDIPSALRMLEGMAGFNGLSLPTNYERIIISLPGGFQQVADFLGIRYEEFFFYQGKAQFIILPLLLSTVLVLPNSLEIASFKKSESVISFQAKTGIGWALMITSLLVFSFLSMTSVSEFLYFQF